MAKKPPFPPKADPKKGGGKADKPYPKKGMCPDCGKAMSLHKGGKCPK